MKRSLKELKERQKKKRQSNLEKSNNRLTSYGFSSSKSSIKKIENNEQVKSNLNVIPNSSLKPPLKRSQSLNVIPNKKIKAEDENTINTLISGHIKKNSFISSFNPKLKHSRSFNEVPAKKVIKNPFQDLTADNTIVKDPFSLLKHISNIDDNENSDEKNKEEPQNSLNNLSSNIFNIDYLNSELKQFAEPPTSIDENDDSKKENNKISYDNLIDKEEFHYYNTRHFIESDDDMSVSDKESVASDTDIKDIEIPHDEYSDDDNMMQFEQTSEPSSNNSLSQNITNKKTSDNQSRLLLDTLQQNDEVNMDINSAKENYILNDIEKKNTKNTEKSNSILEGNGFRDQLKLKNLKQEQNLPYDYTVKRKITFYSNSTFESYGEQTSQDESKCLQAFVRDEKLNNVYKRVQQLLYYYIYPASQFPLSLIKVLQKILWKAKNRDINELMNNPTISDDEKDDLKFFKKNEDDWQQSFRSLYFNLKNRLTDCFYYINSDFSVIFLSNNMVTHSDSYQAVLTNSTPYIKSLLEDEGIKFVEIPFSQSNNIKVKQDLINKDFQNRNGDILLFNDIISIHGLFNFLLNWKLNKNSKDIFIPILVSTKPFLNSIVKSNLFFKNSIIKRSIYNVKQRKNITDEIYQFSIEGFLLPSIYNELIHLIIEQYKNTRKIKKEDQNNPQEKDEGIYIEMITDTRTIGMNIFNKNDIKPVKKEDVKMEEEEENDLKNDMKNSSSNDQITTDNFLGQLLYYNNVYYYNN